MTIYTFTGLASKPQKNYLRDAVVDQIPKVFERSTWYGGTSTLDVDIATLTSAEETLLDALVTQSIGKRPNEYYVSSELEDFVNPNAIVKDAQSGVSGKFESMQVMTNRRELYGDADTDNPLNIPGFKGVTQRTENLEIIHGKMGWHNQLIKQATYQRPASLLIYYGYPNSYNSTDNSWVNEMVAQDMAKHNLIILGDGVQTPSHPDYANTQIIIPRIKALNPSIKIFGYVSVNQTSLNFESKVDDWETLSVDGIFMDEAGYGYGKHRDEFNECVDYVHEQDYANICFVNAWNMDHIIGIVNDTSYPNSTYNLDEEASNLNAEDWYLLESFPINTAAYTASTPNGYEPRADWASRGVKALGHRVSFGINLASVGIINNANTEGQNLFDFSFFSALMFSLDAHGTSDTNYGSGSATVKMWNREATDNAGTFYCLNSCVQVDGGDTEVYWRYLSNGRLKLDFTDEAQSSELQRWTTL